MIMELFLKYKLVLRAEFPNLTNSKKICIFRVLGIRFVLCEIKHAIVLVDIYGKISIEI